MKEKAARALIERLAAQCGDGMMKTEAGSLEETLATLVQAFLTMNAALMAVNQMAGDEVVVALRMSSEDDPTQGAELMLGVATPKGLLESVFSTEVQLHNSH